MSARIACVFLSLSVTLLFGCTVAPHRTVTTKVIARRPAVCTDCGRIEKIDTVRGVAAGTRRKVVLSGVVGGVLTGPSKPAASADAGTGQWVTRLGVRMDDGRHLLINQNVISPNLRVGSRVRLVSGRVVLLR